MNEHLTIAASVAVALTLRELGPRLLREMLKPQQRSHTPPVTDQPPPTRPPARGLACPTCPHGRDSHGPLGCTALFCGCERTWIGGGWP